MQFDVIIVGAGAAGLMCAIECGKRGRKVLLADHAKSVGEKIRISGGGRCNFTNINASHSNYISKNPHFCISALKKYTQNDFIQLVKKHKIEYHEKTLGQLFCNKSSKQIIDMLLKECEASSVKIALNTSVKSINKDSEYFKVELSDDKHYTSESIVIATGGPSIPKMGSSTWGHKIAEKFGHCIIPLRAGLVPFTLDTKTLQETSKLAGTSVDTVISCNGHEFREGMLFTHRGLSGPAVLQISSYWKPGDEITIKMLPDIDIFEQLVKFRQESPKQNIQNTLSNMLTKSLAQHFCSTNNFNGKLADFSNKRFKEVADSLQNWKVKPTGTEGYRTAEVTIGGVDTNELSSKTMESKKIENLYFIGEVVDVTGHLGGYNFQWAWSSGYVAGQYA
jgi:predicted Rossmann fold flavoprotein